MILDEALKRREISTGKNAAVWGPYYDRNRNHSHNNNGHSRSSTKTGNRSHGRHSPKK